MNRLSGCGDHARIGVQLTGKVGDMRGSIKEVPRKRLPFKGTIAPFQAPRRAALEIGHDDAGPELPPTRRNEGARENRGDRPAPGQARGHVPHALRGRRSGPGSATALTPSPLAA
ncbi:hypothetical protein [Burkholderia glumae]|uniref:Uncharacterized protein n=1 Tax=Burkholderia glumae TaxID=337 RepID=A0AAQ0BPY9_BURGL|nr:hypothetical protein [Burkholderia glumae]NVE25229.1 hypothetical protein [Burkholderia glumae]QHE13542.1 hypothetical protein GQR88_25310 [Burkholderia glumae AU6208]QPQ89528.1 hypothetical protein I6H06_07760 [Burkholderia glumae]QQM93360.1 hypothetical protein I6G78_27500 [Burkholderia glumae]